MTSNNRTVNLVLSEQDARFVLENCETNIGFFLATAMAHGETLGEDAMRRLVDINERFKSIRAITKEAIETQLGS